MEAHRRLQSAGFLGGALGGIALAYLESLFLRATLGAFAVGPLFLLRAAAISGAAGAAVATLGAFSSTHAARRNRSFTPARFAAIAAGVVLGAGSWGEAWLYVLEIHVLRSRPSPWSGRAVPFLAAAAVVAALFGASGGLAVSRFARAGRGRRLVAASAAVAVAAALFLAAGRGAGPEPASRRWGPEAPNIVLLVIDSCRADRLASDGYARATTPHLDRLAAAGVRFARAYATSDWTLPTHASLFTGLYPSSHGAFSKWAALSEDLPTLAEILTRSGYASLSLYANRLLGPSTGLARGFRKAVGVDSDHKASLAADRLAGLLKPGGRSSAPRILELADRWISRHNAAGRPAFVFMNFLDLHPPYRPRAPFAAEFLPPGARAAAGSILVRSLSGRRAPSPAEGARIISGLGAAEWEALSAYYDSNLRALDECLGRFVSGLEGRGALADTLLVITSDHGEALGEEGRGGHGFGELPETILRVPLLLYRPGRLRPGVDSRLASQVDIFPTLMAVAGIAGFSRPGADLLGPRADRGVMAESWDEERAEFRRAYLAGEWKLRPGPEGPEVFRVPADPGEKKNLASERPDVLADLRRGLATLLDSIPKRAGGRGPGSADRRRWELLRSLGYIGR